MPLSPSRLLLFCLACAAAPGAVASSAEAEFTRIAALAAQQPEAALREAERWQHALAAGADASSRRYALRALGAALRSAGRYGEASLRFEEALAIADGDAALTDVLRFELGVTFGLAGLHADALEAFRAALPGFEARADWRRLSALLGNIGNELDAAGDRAGAREHYLRALALKREHRLDRGVGGLLNNLADLELAAGDAAAAADRLAKAIAAAQAAQEPEPQSEALARGNRVIALAALGRFAEAEDELAAFDRLDAGSTPRLQALREEAAAVLLRARAAAPDRPEAQRRQLRDAAYAGVQRALQVAAGIDEPRRRARLQRLASELAAEQANWQVALAHSRAAEQEQAAEEARRQRLRETTLAARYRQARQERELAALRAAESLREATLARQRQGLAVAAAGAVLLLLLALLQQRRIRVQRRLERGLQAHNRALGDALDQADAQRQRAEQLAHSHRRLLRLAGDELRAPLLRLRGATERLLVGGQEANREPGRLAALSAAVADLLRVSEQLVEAGSEVLHAPAQAAVDVAALIAELHAQAIGRAPTPHDRLRLAVAGPCVARVDGSRLQLLLQELLQWLLDDTRWHERRVLRLDVVDDRVQVSWPDPHGRLQRRLGAGGEAGAEVVPALGALWVRRTVEALGGELLPGESGGELLLRLPAAP
jgi:hypothetical protein